MSVSLKRTYTTNDDGTGVIKFTVNLPETPPRQFTLDLVITKAKFVNAVWILYLFFRSDDVTPWPALSVRRFRVLWN